MPALPTQRRTACPLHIHTSTRAENETRKGHNRKDAHIEYLSLVKNHRWCSMSEYRDNNPAGAPQRYKTYGGAARTPEPGRCWRTDKDKKKKNDAGGVGVDPTCSRRAPCCLSTRPEDPHAPPNINHHQGGTPLDRFNWGAGRQPPFLHHTQTDILSTNNNPTGAPPTDQKQGGTGRKPRTNTTKPTKTQHPLGQTHLTPPSPAHPLPAHHYTTPKTTLTAPLTP